MPIPTSHFTLDKVLLNLKRAHSLLHLGVLKLFTVDKFLSVEERRMNEERSELVTS